MKRRKFLLNFAVAGIILLDIKKALANLLMNILPWQSERLAGNLTIQFEGQSPKNIPLVEKNGLLYISALNFAKSLQCHTYFNDAKKKIVLYLPQNKVVVTAKNAFVIIDDQPFQMPATAIWQDPDILVPVKYFLPMLNRRTTLTLDYNERNQITKIRTKDINISDVEISSRKNGTVLRFKTFKDFKQGEITADMRYGWLHIDFYGYAAFLFPLFIFIFIQREIIDSKWDVSFLRLIQRQASMNDSRHFPVGFQRSLNFQANRRSAQIGLSHGPRQVVGV